MSGGRHILKRWPRDTEAGRSGPETLYEPENDGLPSRKVFDDGRVQLYQVDDQYILRREAGGLLFITLDDLPLVTVDVTHVAPSWPWAVIIKQSRGLSVQERDLVGTSIASQIHWVHDAVRVQLDGIHEPRVDSGETRLVHE